MHRDGGCRGGGTGHANLQALLLDLDLAQARLVEQPGEVADQFLVECGFGS
jgi:hypothetical protein